jgi:hypothetical protein
MLKNTAGLESSPHRVTSGYFGARVECDRNAFTRPSWGCGFFGDANAGIFGGRGIVGLGVRDSTLVIVRAVLRQLKYPPHSTTAIEDEFNCT